VNEWRDESMDRAQAGGAGQLCLDRCGVGGVEEARIGELLQAGETEGEPEEEAQWNRRPTG
jgi:hypothetical protein